VTSPPRSVIEIRGARQNNLRDIDAEFPRARLSVITGVSGSGKSSLAIDTLYAEGQRRYVASLSTYARQFLDRLPRPDVEAITGLPPAIAIERANPIVSRRSTVGTATEVYDYMRLLWARAGMLWCPECEAPVRSWSAVQVADRLSGEPEGSGWIVAFPLPISDALTHDALTDNLRALGFVRVVAGGREAHLDDVESAGADLTAATPLFVVVDRVRVGKVPRSRLVEAVERAYEEGEGRVVLFRRGETSPERAIRFDRHMRCDACQRSFRAPRPSLFSFNNPYGACPRCNGFGHLLEYDTDRIVPDPDASLAEGAIDPWTKPRYGRRREKLRSFAREASIPWDAPWRDLPEPVRRTLLHGGRVDGVRFEGIVPFLGSLERKKYKAYIRFFLRSYQSYRLCPDCRGSRLRAEARWVRLGERALPEVVAWPFPRLTAWLDALGPTQAPEAILGPVLRELRHRVDLLIRVGLDYLSLDRLTRTLSGGEAQRIALANALGSPLTDGLYVLDEPSVGLHARDTDRMIELLRELVDRGNTVVVVEHDLDVVRAADRVVELGPGAGAAGGGVVFSGSPEDLAEADTVTGRWLRGEASLPGRKVRSPGEAWLEIRGAREHNLDDIDVAIPLQRLTAVTGVSGSGKTTLVHDVVVRGVARRLGNGGDTAPGEHDGILGAERLSGVVLVDQSPIGKTPRSNPVTYVKAFDPIRQLFAGTPGARRRGLGAGHFSFNTKDGRCRVCKGDGHERIEMHFLPDAFVTCEACGGRRYRPEVLEARWRGLSIADVLDLTVDEAITRLEGEPAAAKRLWVLQSVGLGYLRLGQPATTLSGGESQRLKIARQLATSQGSRDRRLARGTLYVLDEPTTGLHHADVLMLIRVLDELVERGHTVVVVEHHLDVVARADWIIDLGPEGGDAGGRVVAAGVPAEIHGHERSHTARALRERTGVEEEVGV